MQTADSIYLDTTEVEIAKERVRRARQAAKAHAASLPPPQPREPSATRGRGKDPLGTARVRFHKRHVKAVCHVRCGVFLVSKPEVSCSLHVLPFDSQSMRTRSCTYTHAHVFRV